ncbi:MAG: type VI secretion system-associated protein TagF [Betaproteobacteria bacterium]
MAGCGFYGKLPSEGDFVTRRLPWEFTSAWDDWLQQGMQASRETLGARWLELYLSAPIWRFQVAPGVCGPLGWRGLFFASVDRVGRYFPLTLAFADGGAPALATLSGDAESWLVAEDAALEALAPTLPIDAFDRLVEALVIPGGVSAPSAEPARARLCLYTLGSEDVPATGLTFDGLPSPATFVELLAPSAAPPAPGSLTDLLGA